MSSVLATAYRHLSLRTRIISAILLFVLLIAGVAGAYRAASFIAALTGEKCALDMPVGTIVQLDTGGMFAQKISRNNWELSSDTIVDNCYIIDHIQKTKNDCQPENRLCRMTFSPAGTDLEVSGGETWTKTGINEWQNESGDIRGDTYVSAASMLSHPAPEEETPLPNSGDEVFSPPFCCSGDLTSCSLGDLSACGEEPSPSCCSSDLGSCSLGELTECGDLNKPCASSSTPNGRGVEESSSSSSSSPACTAVYYKFDEGSGSTTLNALASTHAGSLINSPAWSADHAPTLFQNTGALAFDGSNKVTIPTLAPPTAPFTMSVWIKAPMTENADQVVIQWGNESWILAVGHRNYTLYRCMSANGTISPTPNGTDGSFKSYDTHLQSAPSDVCGPYQTPVDIQNQDLYYFIVNGAYSQYGKHFQYPSNEIWYMPHSDWVHLAYVRDDANVNNRHLYINGVDIGALGSNNVRTPVTGLTIGNLNSAATWLGSYSIPSLLTQIVYYVYPGYPSGYIEYWYPAQGFNGLIDDVRVYNRSLSASEVASLAAGQNVLFGCEASSASSSSSSSSQSSASSSTASSTASSTQSSAASTASSEDASEESSANSTGSGSSLSSSSAP